MRALGTRKLYTMFDKVVDKLKGEPKRCTTSPIHTRKKTSNNDNSIERGTRPMPCVCVCLCRCVRILSVSSIFNCIHFECDSYYYVYYGVTATEPITFARTETNRLKNARTQTHADTQINIRKHYRNTHNDSSSSSNQGVRI